MSKTPLSDQWLNEALEGAAGRGCPKCLVGQKNMLADPVFACDLCSGTGIPHFALISASAELLRIAKITAAFHAEVRSVLTKAIEQGGNRFNSADMLKAFTDRNETELLAAIAKAEGRS